MLFLDPKRSFIPSDDRNVTSFSCAFQVITERQRNVHLNLPKTLEFLARTDMTLADLDALPVIHVTGTKGKGSTGIFLENILRRKGLKVGFFSSPHLVTVTERIRIDGRPISQEKFTDHFWRVFDQVCLKGHPTEPEVTTCGAGEERPPYFKFLTLLALNVFWREAVDVAIMEVGIGGRYDCTNIVRRPRACGITSLGIDHTSILGKTIEEIAWHKVGIAKAGVPLIVDAKQPPSAMKVIRAEAEKVGCPVFVAPSLQEYDWGHFPPMEIGLYGEVQRQNASMALQLSRAFLLQQENSCNFDGRAFSLDVADALGLKLCSWPGRSQVVSLKYHSPETLANGNVAEEENVHFLLDCAHTKESCEACTKWFNHQSQVLQDERGVKRAEVFRILLFNSTKDHPFRAMLSILKREVDLDLVVFTTNVLSAGKISDNINYMSSHEGRIARCNEHAACWEEPDPASSSDLDPVCPSVIIPCLDDAINWITQQAFLETPEDAEDDHLDAMEGVRTRSSRSGEVKQVQILTMGSIHLIGGVLELIRPDIYAKSEAEAAREQGVVAEYHRLADLGVGVATNGN